MSFEAVPWDAALVRIGTSEPDWLFISGVTEHRLAPIATAPWGPSYRLTDPDVGNYIQVKRVN